MVVARLVGTVYGAKSGNDQDLPLLLLGKWLSLPPLMVQPAATLLSEHGRDQKDFTGKYHSHPYQLVVSSSLDIQFMRNSDKLFYPPSG